MNIRFLARTHIHIIWGVSRKLATSVNQGDTILTMMDVLKLQLLVSLC